LYEETNITLKPKEHNMKLLTIIQYPRDTTLLRPANLMFTFVCELKDINGFSIKPIEDDVSECKWFTKK
jgi:8-oxo-dGTP pyrophosphatase MutT (NUDIX family)